MMRRRRDRSGTDAGTFTLSLEQLQTSERELLAALEDAHATDAAPEVQDRLARALLEVREELVKHAAYPADRRQQMEAGLLTIGMVAAGVGLAFKVLASSRPSSPASTSSSSSRPSSPASTSSSSSRSTSSSSPIDLEQQRDGVFVPSRSP